MNSVMNRRDLCAALSAFAALALSAEGQAPGDNMAVPAPPGSAGDPTLDRARAIPFDQLPVVKTENGETRAVIRGVLPTGEAIELHETTLLPGHMPHPAHTHRHSEVVMVREGRMQLMDEGRPAGIVGPGGVLFFASNKLHGLKNVGETPANYFVIAIGRES